MAKRFVLVVFIIIFAARISSIGSPKNHNYLKSASCVSAEDLHRLTDTTLTIEAVCYIPMDDLNNLTKLESPIEEKFYPFLKTLSHPNCDLLLQHEIQLTDKITFRPDFTLYNRVHGKRILIECDGQDFHSSGSQTKRDELRDAAMILDDNTLAVFRFGGIAIHHFPELCIEKIREFQKDIYFIITHYPKAVNPAKHFLFPERRESFIEEFGEAAILAYERADDLIVVHDRTWLINSGIVRKARFVAKESTTTFNKIELDYAKFIVKNYG